MNPNETAAENATAQAGERTHAGGGTSAEWLRPTAATNARVGAARRARAASASGVRSQGGGATHAVGMIWAPYRRG